MSELKNAAERLRNGDEIYQQTFQAAADEGRLAREYLRLTDPTPLTPDVLKRVCFEQFMWVYDNGCKVFVDSGSSLEHWAAALQFPPRNLGELRQLANRLNLTLTE